MLSQNITAMKKLLFLFVIIPFLLFQGCKEENPFTKVDISNIKITQKLYRFDKDLYNIPEDSLTKEVPRLIKQYDGFLELYSNQIIRIGSPYSKDFPERLKVFKSDYVVSETYKYAEKKYKDFSPYFSEINKAFKYYHYYFPDKAIPNVYTYVSGFNVAIATDSAILGIGLDFYLGKDFEFYPNLALPYYIVKKMEPYMILPDAIRGWLAMEFAPTDSMNTLLDNMIYGGKILYVMNAIMPNVPDTIKFGYSQQQIEWCKENEEEMWSYFVEKKILFSTERILIKKFVDEAPFTIPFGRKSPPKTGIWIGYRIVSKYMKKHSEISLRQLMEEKNSQKILTYSGYNP